MLVSQHLPPEQLVQSTMPGQITLSLILQRTLQYISPEEILLHLFSAEELVNELLFPHLDLTDRERAILKAAILRTLSDSDTLRQALRQRIRDVLGVFGKISSPGETKQ